MANLLRKSSEKISPEKYHTIEEINVGQKCNYTKEMTGFSSSSNIEPGGQGVPFHGTIS